MDIVLKMKIKDFLKEALLSLAVALIVATIGWLLRNSPFSFPIKNASIWSFLTAAIICLLGETTDFFAKRRELSKHARFLKVPLRDVAEAILIHEMVVDRLTSDEFKCKLDLSRIAKRKNGLTEVNP